MTEDNKIQQQQAIVDELYVLGEKNALSLETECNNNFGTFENKPLEEMIDHGNIHGWLQERVSQVEYKYAYCITKLLEKNLELKASITDIVAGNAANLAASLKEYSLDAAGIFKVIEDNLLDGMPCDHANRVLSKSADKVTWIRTLCVHSNYWAEVGGDITIYYELRDAWIQALVKELGFGFEKTEDATYSIVA
ncbi:MAG: hypothetical protein K0S04_1931 [Herbinix sp.]|nr:hypothetical protein [Herbinix sp.]